MGEPRPENAELGRRIKRLEDECIALEGVIGFLFQTLKRRGGLSQEEINHLFDAALAQAEARPDAEFGVRRTVERLSRLATPGNPPSGA